MSATGRLVWWTTIIFIYLEVCTGILNVILEVPTGLSITMRANTTNFLKEGIKMKEFEKINLRCAVDALNYTSYLSIDDLDKSGSPLHSNFGSPEDQYCKKELLLKLPKEAFMILQLIYNTPTEILEELSVGTKSGQGRGIYTGKRKLISFIKSHYGWPTIKIERSLNKIKNIF
jgi:hypothetical protein